MKFFVLAVLIGAVASNPRIEAQKWPWQVGKIYNYDVNSYTVTKFEDSINNGNAFKAQFIIRVKAPGQLIAKLENPLYTQIKTHLTKDLPSDLIYQPLENLDSPFEILVDGGRILSFDVPSVALPYENLLKGLISALQVDISSFGNVHDYPNNFDSQNFQGLFKKMEADVTGECEILYSVSPMPAEWRRELPTLTAEDPIEIVKSKNYGVCKKRIAYSFGVPEGAIWKGIAFDNEEEQFIKHTSEARLIIGKQGTIYKSEVMSSVLVNPLMFGKQKSDVHSFVKFNLNSVEIDDIAEWTKSDKMRTIDSLLYSMSDSISFFTQADEKNIVNAQKLLQEIAPVLQNSDQLSGANFLSKFNILVRLIASMTLEQLNLMTSNIKVAENNKDIMWQIYRDAVAQSGTVAAFNQIKSWIMDKTVQNEQAAELISSLSSNLRNPSQFFISEFFNFAMSPVIIEQKFLNNSALLATTQLIRKSEDKVFVVETVIPRFSQELKNAIENEDRNKAQVYVRVLGSLGHPNILEVFAPYLEGRVKVTKYLRIQMVTSLKTLANMKADNVHVVLYSILRNSAEPYEVRVAAALNIFMAIPTPEMMQVMAHMTNDDPSTQVRAVLKNSITFAAGLKDPRFSQLAKTAKSVINLVAKEKFGYRYSTDTMADEYTSDEDFSFFRELSFIGSKDSILPVYQRSSLRSRTSLESEENQMTLSVSNVPQLIDHIMETFSKSHPSETNFKYSAKKIAEILNIKRVPRDPLEGTLFVENWNEQKLITFTEREVDSFIQGIISTVEDFLFGVSNSYTRVLSQKQVTVMFPLAMGMPFIFEYSEPTVLKMEWQANIRFARRTNVQSNFIKFTYARNLDGQVGFLDTLSDAFVTTGVINKVELNLPIVIQVMYKFHNVKLTFSANSDKDVNLVHLSVWPYTTVQKKGSLKTIFEETTTEFVKPPMRTFSTDYKFGQNTGAIFDLKGFSYSTDYKNLIDLLNKDILTSVSTLLYQKDVAMTEFNLKYMKKESKNRKIELSLLFDIMKNQNIEGEMGQATFKEDVSPFSAMRREKMAKQVAAGIPSASVYIADINVAFKGQENTNFMFTSALARSHVDRKIQAAVFLQGTEQVNAVFRVTGSKIVPLNFKNAISNNINNRYEVDVLFANSSNIQVDMDGVRTENYASKLINDPVGKQCMKDTADGNFYQRDCYEMIVKAHAPDLFRGTVSYTGLDNETLKSNCLSLFKTLNTIYSFNDITWSGPLNINGRGNVDFEIAALYYEAKINYRLSTKDGSLSLKNMEGMLYYPYATSIYMPITSWERSRNWFTNNQNLPFCTVDSSKIWTFSGRSYNYSLTNSWHVVMLDETKYDTDLVILARRPSDDHLEVYISYKISGEALELDITPSNIDVTTNGTKISDGPVTLYTYTNENEPLLEYFSSDVDGIQIFQIKNTALRIVYDRQRLVIFTDLHRSTTRGICGQSNTEIRDDYITPWGIVDNPELYGASFSLEDDLSDPKTVALKKEAKLKAYQPVVKYTSILHSSAEWNKAENESIKGL